MVLYLKSFCERIEIAGSVRRKKEEVKDIEIVAIPKFHKTSMAVYQSTFDFKGILSVPMTQADLLGTRVQQLIAEGILVHGEPSKGMTRAPCGPKYYRLKYDGEKLDLFSVISPAQWGVVFTIRTGDRDFSHWLAQRALEIGMRIDEGALYSPRVLISTPEEADFFKALKVKWIEPEKRDFSKGLNVRELIQT